MTNEELQNLYDEIGNIKKVAKISHVSYRKLRTFIKFKHKTKNKRNTEDYRKKIKQQCVNYKGGKCQVCGYCKCIEALEFHHINHLEKEFTISGGTRSFESLKLELDKCILLCANCHRELHSGKIIL